MWLKDSLGALWIMAAVAMAPVSLPSQVSAAPSAPLTLEQCVSTALGGSPVEQSAELTVESFAHAEGAARAPYFPTLGFGLSGSRWQRRIFLPNGLFPPGATMPTLIGPTDDYALSLNAAYTLFDGGERKAQLGVAKAKRRASEADGGRAKQDLTLSVHQTFFALASALAQREVARQDLSRAEDHLRIASDRKEAGTAPLVDVRRAEANLAGARLALARAEGAVREARGALATSMGLPAFSPIDIAPSDQPPGLPSDADLQDAERLAVKSRPAVLAAAEGVESARQSVALARSAFSPKVGAFASYGREDVTWYPEDKTWAVGVSLSVPVFAGFAHREGLAKAKAELARAESDRRQVELLVQKQVWDAYSGLLTGFEAVGAAASQVASAKEAERLARERYEAGVGTLSELLDAGASLALAEANRVAAEWDYRAARTRFQWSAGALGKG